MLSLRNFNELLYLWSFFAMEARYCYRFEEKDRKKILTNIDHKRTRQCHMRVHAVEAALKCLIAKYPAPILYTFVHPQITAYQSAYYMRDTTEPE